MMGRNDLRRAKWRRAAAPAEFFRRPGMRGGVERRGKRFSGQGSGGRVQDFASERCSKVLNSEP